MMSNSVSNRGIPLSASGTKGRHKVSAFLKRLLDVTAASTGLVLLSPVLIATGFAVRFRMGSPVLFRQLRAGLHGQAFTLYKFRTMSVAADDPADLTGELRLTAFGRSLRRTSLDELPSLWNVLRGDMSLVGPRPLHMEYLPLYTAEQARRHEVRPGITGWVQVNGRNALAWEKRFELDVWYVDNWSLRLDLSILLRTIRSVFLREGISPEGRHTMPAFTGSAAQGAN